MKKDNISIRGTEYRPGTSTVLATAFRNISIPLSQIETVKKASPVLCRELGPVQSFIRMRSGKIYAATAGGSPVDIAQHFLDRARQDIDEAHQLLTVPARQPALV